MVKFMSEIFNYLKDYFLSVKSCFINKNSEELGERHD